VNYPQCVLDRKPDYRLLVANKNIPNMVGQITTILAAENINITDLINHHKGEYAFNIIDTQHRITDAIINKIKKINGVVRVRAIVKE
jgi:D-3-phosphoglycerate dehydrogenase